ncbi:MAG: diacylglycerol/lipid kinase family protein [Chloroflexota bacterium]
MTAKIILNPYAGRWKALKLRPQVEAALEAEKIDYELALSEGSQHATQLAAEAVRAGFTPIIAAGGDGTISEIVNGLWQATAADDPLSAFGLLPLGSANDLANNLGLPLDLKAAVKRITRGQTRRIDLCEVKYGSPSKPRCFVNNAAIGLEPTVTLIQAGMKRLRGTPRYLLAALRGVYANPQWNAHVTWEGGGYEGPVSLVSVGNGPITGGLFYMAPYAVLDDGQLTFVYGHVPRRLDMFRILPATMKPGEGNYIENPAIHQVHTSWLHIQTDTPTPLHADGEIQSEGVQEMEFRILPKGLDILA